MKGISTLIVAILLVLIATSLATLFFAWGNEVNRMFKSTTENITQEKISQSQASFFVATVAENKIAIKNNGEVPLDVGDFNVYLNDTLTTATPENPSQTKVNPGEMLYLVVSAPDGNYTIRVSGPYGKMDELFDEIAEAWLSGFDYRRNITITESSGNDLTNYQILITLTTSNFDYSKTQSDGSDIRFTDSDKTTRLSYWIEDWNPVGDSKIWVEIPSLPASSSKDIYMYYGNTTPVSSESDGTKTFLFFDDFENLNQWTVYGTGTVDTTTVDGRTVVKFSKCNEKRISSNIQLNFNNISIERMLKYWGSASDQDDFCGIISQKDKRVWRHTDNSINKFAGTTGEGSSDQRHGIWNFYNSVDTHSIGTKTISSSWELHQIIKIDNTLSSIYNGEIKTITPSNVITSGYVQIFNDADDDSRGVYVDWIRVRNYSSPEPTYAISTNEETH